jgi:tetratricopeptide (TPR) repeat protein
MHKTILLITLLFVCFGIAYAEMSPIEKEYFDTMKQQYTQQKEDIERLNKDAIELKSSLDYQVKQNNLLGANVDRNINTITIVFSALSILGAIFGFIYKRKFDKLITQYNEITKQANAIQLQHKEIESRTNLIQSKHDSFLIEVKETERRIELLYESNISENSLTTDAEHIKPIVKEYVEKLHVKNKNDYSITDWMAIGNGSIMLDEYENAKEAYMKVTEIKPEYFPAWFNLGYVLSMQNDFLGAVSAYNRATTIQPDNQNAWYNKGCVFADLKLFPDAINAYNEAIRISPNKYDAWNNKGNAHVELNQLEEAWNAFEMATKIKPNYSLPWNGKAIVLMHQKKYKQALDTVNKSLDLHSDYNAQDTKAAILLKMGEFKEALEWSKKAIDLMPENAENKEEVEKTHKEIIESIAAKEKEKEV